MTIIELFNLTEVATANSSSKQPTPDQQRLKSLSNQRVTASQNEKRERARQQMGKAQLALRQANVVKPVMPK